MQGYFESTIVTSESHWPGRQCTVIQFQGNDYRCPFGPASVEQQDDNQRDLKELITETRKALVYSQALFLTGGEPLLQREALLQVLRTFRKKNLPLGMETNATKPALLKRIISDKLIDFIRVRLPAPLEPRHFEKVTRSATFFKNSRAIIQDVKEGLEYLRNYQEKLEITFSTTVVPGLIYRKEDLACIGKEIADFDSAWNLAPLRVSGNNTLSKRYADINPPSRRFMLELARELSLKFPRLTIQVN